MARTSKLMPPVHPGEILLEDFMKPLRLSVNKLALDLHVPATRIGEIVIGAGASVPTRRSGWLGISKLTPNSGSICKIFTNSNSPVVPARFQKSNATFTPPPSWLVSDVLSLRLL